MKRLYSLLSVICLMLAFNVSAQNWTDYRGDVYIIGAGVNGQNWVLGAEDCLMTQTSPGVYEWDGTQLNSGFKFNDGSWDGEFNLGADFENGLNYLREGEPYTQLISGGGDIRIEDDYNNWIVKPHVVLDMNTASLTVTGDVYLSGPIEGEILDDWDGTMYIIGECNSWTLADPEYAMTYEGDGVFIWRGAELPSGFKFNDGTWSNNYLPGTNVMANIGANYDYDGNIDTLPLGLWQSFYADSNSADFVYSDVDNVINPIVTLDIYSGMVLVTGEGVNVPTPPTTIDLNQYYFLVTSYDVNNGWQITSATEFKAEENLYVAREIAINPGQYFSISDSEVTNSFSNNFTGVVVDDENTTVYLGYLENQVLVVPCDLDGVYDVVAAVEENNVIRVTFFRIGDNEANVDALKAYDGPLYLTGFFSDWMEGVEMTRTAEGIFECDVEHLGSGFKIYNGDSWFATFPGSEMLINIGGTAKNNIVLGEPIKFQYGINNYNFGFSPVNTLVEDAHVVVDLVARTITVTGTPTTVDFEYYLVGMKDNWSISENYHFYKAYDKYKLDKLDFYAPMSFKIVTQNWLEEFGMVGEQIPVTGDEVTITLSSDSFGDVLTDLNGLYNAEFTINGTEIDLKLTRIGDSSRPTADPEKMKFRIRQAYGEETWTYDIENTDEGYMVRNLDLPEGEYMFILSDDELTSGFASTAPNAWLEPMYDATATLYAFNNIRYPGSSKNAYYTRVYITDRYDVRISYNPDCTTAVVNFETLPPIVEDINLEDCAFVVGEYNPETDLWNIVQQQFLTSTENGYVVKSMNINPEQRFGIILVDQYGSYVGGFGYPDDNVEYITDDNTSITLQYTSTPLVLLCDLDGMYDITIVKDGPQTITATFDRKGDIAVPVANPADMLFQIYSYRDSSIQRYEPEMVAENYYVLENMSLPESRYGFALLDENMTTGFALKVSHWLPGPSYTLPAFNQEVQPGIAVYYTWVDFNGRYNIHFEYNPEHTAVTITFEYLGSVEPERPAVVLSLPQGGDITLEGETGRTIRQLITAPDHWHFRGYLINGSFNPIEGEPTEWLFEYTYGEGRDKVEFLIDYPTEYYLNASTGDVEVNLGSDIRVYLEEGTIVVDAFSNTKIRVFNAGGLIMDSHMSTDKFVRIVVEPGVYIVKINNTPIKVVLE